MCMSFMSAGTRKSACAAGITHGKSYFPFLVFRTVGFGTGAAFEAAFGAAPFRAAPFGAASLAASPPFPDF